MGVIERAWRTSDHHFIVAIGPKGVKHLPVSSPEQAYDLAVKVDAAGAEAYWAPAGFSAPKRKQDAAIALPGFWIDLDGKDQPDGSIGKGLLALLQWCKDHGVPNPHDLILSGNGVHAYWWLDAAYPHEQWLPIAQHFKQALAVGGVQADPTRTADAASILRVPGTHNRKDPANLREVTVLHSSDAPGVPLSDFQAALPAVGPIRSLSRPKRDDEWAVQDNYPAGDAEAIAERCAQMRKIRDTRGAVSEPFWRAGLSVLARCADAEHYVHEWSKGDERYDPHETQKKADATAGPATCGHFNEVHPGGCTGCPLAGKVNSPIQAAVAAAKAPELPQRQAGEPVQTRPTKIGGFQITDAGVYFQPPAGDGEPEPPKRVTQVPMWISEVRERARDGNDRDHSSLLVEWRSIDGRDKSAVLHQSDVHDARSFKAWLADHNIISAVQEVGLLVKYISEMTLATLRQQGVREYHESLGWYEQGFVCGENIITPQGSKPALVQSTNPISRLKPRGNVDAWRDSVSVLNKPGYEHHAFALLAGFGSPVLSLAGVQSAVVSLVGISGAGKTLSAKAALSIYGDPENLSQAASASSNAIERQLGCNRHVPYLLDEVTHLSLNRLTEFIYLAANGAGKDALTRNRENRNTGSWQLVPFITSNHPVLEFHQRDVEEAHRRRVLEVHFNEAMGAQDGATLEAGIRENAGAAAEPFLQLLAKCRTQVPRLFEKAVEKIRAEQVIPDANRFGIWTLAGALVGGSIAKAAGLIDMDPWPIIRQVMAQYEQDVQQTLTPEQRIEAALREFLAANSKRVCRWDTDGNDLGEVVDDPVARVYRNGQVAVHSKEFHSLLHDERISRTAIREWLGEHSSAKPKSVRLAPGTPPVWSVIFDAEALGWDEDKGG